MRFLKRKEDNYTGPTRNFTAGFSIVEMLVSVALFSMVVLLCVAALISLMDANKKARSLKIAMDNLTVVVDDMARDLRLGSKYFCQTVANSNNPIVWSAGTNKVQDCVYTSDTNSGGQYVSFRDRYGKAAFFRLSGTTLQKKIAPTNWSLGYSDNLNSGYSTITSSDIRIDRFRFYVYNTNESSGAQPHVVISIKGTAGISNPKTQTSFSLMTSGNQRIPHNVE